VPVASAGSSARTGPGDGAAYVNERHGWSIVVPPGWDVREAPDGCCVALEREGAIAEVLVSPSGGLTLEELQAEKMAFFRTWSGTDDHRSEIVPLPAGDAVMVTFRTSTNPDVGPGIFVHYAIPRGDTQFVISVRGREDDRALVAEAEQLAESLAIRD
jgi:hypothetical protein